ncbi:hypothetical protein MMC31_004473 [Peltigera leucophlebia]|nr:hypothetical protein [Peltigera leucophlebia]
MLFAGALFSAAAILLGIFTKLTQGGGGFINNLMVLSCFYSPPPLLPPPPPPRAIFFDHDASVFDIRHYYIRDLRSTGNITEGPMPSPLVEPPVVPGSENQPPPNSTFSLPGFAIPAFSPLLRFYLGIGAILTRIAMAFLTLSLPWLAARQLYLLDVAMSARKAAGTPLIIATGFEQRFWQIPPHNPLFDDLKIAISECDKSLTKLMQITQKAEEEEKKALERDREHEESMKGLRKERDNLLEELAKVERTLGEVQKANEDEIEVLKAEITMKARGWEEKELKWVENKAEDEKRNKEEKDSLKMGRERESESWRMQVEGLEVEKQEEKESMRRELRNFSEARKKERERWATEREGWKKEKEDEAREKETMEAERRNLEKKTSEEKKSWEEANDRAQRRIVELEDENTRLTNEAAAKEKLDDEREAARKASEETRAEEVRLRGEEEQAKAKKATSKLEDEVLNGRKLIEDLQSDKRRDRQMLLELRAQLVRPTHAVPPGHLNPLRFGGSSQAAYGVPNFTPSPTFFFTSSPASPQGALPRTLPSNRPPALHSSISSTDAVNQDVDWPPIVRLPPPPPPREGTIPARIPAPILPPANTPKGPKGWTPGPPRGA